MQEERQKAASGGIPSGNSDTEDTMTTSSSAPSPGTLSGSRSNQHTTPNDTSAFNTQGTSMLSMHFHFRHSVQYKFINYTRFSKSFLSHILRLQNLYDEDYDVKNFPIRNSYFHHHWETSGLMTIFLTVDDSNYLKTSMKYVDKLFVIFLDHAPTYFSIWECMMGH